MLSPVETQDLLLFVGHAACEHGATIIQVAFVGSFCEGCWIQTQVVRSYRRQMGSGKSVRATRPTRSPSQTLYAKLSAVISNTERETSQRVALVAGRRAPRGIPIRLCKSATMRGAFGSVARARPSVFHALFSAALPGPRCDISCRPPLKKLFKMYSTVRK